MSNTIETIDFNSDQLKRQVVETFNQYLKEQSSSTGIFLANGANFPDGTAQKYEWLENQLSPELWTINGQVPVWANKTIVVDDSSGIMVGQIIRFKDPTSNSPIGNLQVKVTSITNATTFEASVYGSTTDVIIPDNAIANFVNRPIKENNKNFIAENDHQLDQEYNYFQNFEVSVELSDTALNTASYSNITGLTQQMTQGMYKFNQQISEGVFYGQRVQRTTTENGTFGGIESFIDVVDGNVVDAWGAAITPKLINDLGVEIKKQGGSFNAIMTNFEQARAISAFNTSGNNPITQTSLDERRAGSVIMEFQSDLPIEGGIISRIIVDEKVPNNKIYLVDTNKIALVPYTNRWIRLVEGTQRGQDGVTALLRAELTLAVQDAKYSHGVLKNLQVT